MRILNVNELVIHLKKIATKDLAIIISNSEIKINALLTRGGCGASTPGFRA